MENVYLLLKYLFLGLFQGFTEPIPISSSGHLILAEHLLGLKIEGLSFELLVNFASLLAVLMIYREDIMRLTVNGLSYVAKRDPHLRSDFNFIMYLIIATIPVGVIGVLYGDLIAQYFKGTKTIGITLVITGIALWLIRNLRGQKGDRELSFKDSIIIGIAQAVALIPGISRSGATIVAAMGLGMKQDTALRFSFLLYIPVSLGGTLLAFSDILSDPRLSELIVPYTIAFFASLFASYFSLKWFIGLMAKGNLIYFALYCIIAGASVVIFM